MTSSETLTPTPPEETVDGKGSGGGGWLAFGGIAMLIASLTILRAYFSFSLQSGDLALSVASSALPLLTLAGISAGAAVGLWVVGRFSFSLGYRRILATVASGSLTGALASASVLLIRGIPAEAAGVVALVLGLAGALGGALAAIRPQAIVRGGVAATLTALVLFFVVAFNSNWLLRLFGDDGTLAGREAANGLLAGAQALTIGLIGGLVAFFTMRRSGSRWPAYLIAGGMPGLLWIVGDIVTRLGTAKLLTLAASDASGDRHIQQGLELGRINTGLVLFFVGAITAIIALGRTLPRTPN
ncbi:hypothetical protein [Allorhizocola rhizosphaerae]|uniref:hypothetical protein n=1 Tax=Allorhizocola rhizosphaerae TaxID=1872709 RepID=UPI0013C3721E|nr:hypothetical protein [Allorhizocola rhizosphaerae]